MKIKATYEASTNRILAKWDYTPDYQRVIDALKIHCMGPRFRPSDKVWTMPATVNNCIGLREAFGDDLKVKEPLSAWYLENAKALEEAVASTGAADAELHLLPSVAPTLSATLRADQRAGVVYIAEAYRGSALIADKPGLGKTMQAIGGVLEAGRKGNILVVCPKISVKNVWRKEIHTWTDESVHICRGTRAQRQGSIAEFLADPAERKWLVIVAEMLRVQRKPNETEVKANAKKRGRIAGFEYPELFENIKWDTIICDESQRLLGSLSIAKSNLMGEGLTRLPQPLDRRRYAMSGTPFGKGGRVTGMFGTLHWLWPDEYTAFWKWAERHFEIEEKVIGRGKTAKKVGNLRDGRGGEEFLRSLGPRILRRTKEEVLPNLPPKQYVEVLCEMGPKQRAQYKQLGDDAEVNVPGGTIIANGVLAEITRAKQIAGGTLAMRGDKVIFSGESCKVDAFIEKMDARGILDGADDTKVIVSSRYNEFITGALIPRLEKEGVRYHLLTGKTTERARDHAMDTFQAEGGPQVFIMNSKAGGVSITLDAADEVHCLDELDNPEDNEQLEDRAHRASRIHQVTIFYYRTEGTYDVNIGATVEEKRLNQFAVLDGRRGLQDVRNWIKYQEVD